MSGAIAHLAEWGIRITKGTSVPLHEAPGAVKAVQHGRAVGNMQGLNSTTTLKTLAGNPEMIAALSGIAAIGFDLAALADPTGALSLGEALFHIYQAEYVSAGFSLIGAVPVAGKGARLAHIVERMPSYLGTMLKMKGLLQTLDHAGPAAAATASSIRLAISHTGAAAAAAIRALEHAPMGALPAVKKQQVIGSLRHLVSECGAVARSGSKGVSAVAQSSGAHHKLARAINKSRMTHR